MKKSILSAAIIAAVTVTVSGNASAVVINWGDNTSPSVGDGSKGTTVDQTATLVTPMAAGNEFRVVATTGGISGGGEKSILGSSAISWEFDGNDDLVSATGGDVTPGANYYGTPSQATSAQPGGGPGLFANAPFLGSPFGFLAPTTTSLAGAEYGVASLVGFSTGNTFQIHFPVMEAQWNQGLFNMGQSTGGIDFNCVIAGDNVTVDCEATHLIAGSEDSLGFAGQVMQWDITGTLDAPHTSAVPVPAAAWLFGSGLLGLVGVARRKKSA